MHAKQHVDQSHRDNEFAHRRFLSLANRFGFRRTKGDDYWIDAKGHRVAVPGKTDRDGAWMYDWKVGIQRLINIVGAVK